MKLAAGILFCAAALTAQTGPVTFDRIVQAIKEPRNWLTYWGDYSGIRHRDLNQINTSNIKDLRLDWMYQTGIGGAFQTMPLVVDGVMYLTAGEGVAAAVDAKTGRQLWKYKYPLPTGQSFVTGTINRGLAILGSAPSWRQPTLISSRSTSATANSSGKLVVKDKVIAGVRGGEYGIRGFVDAFDVNTGKRA